MDTDIIETPDGLDMEIPSGCLISSRFADGVYENDLIAAVERAIDNGPRTIVDAGAHVGNHSIRFGMFADYVLSFEPSRQLFGLLARNFDANEDRIEATVRFHRCALGDARGHGRVFIEEGNTGNTLVSPANDERSADRFCPIRRLDRMIPDRRVGAIKVDVEGMEMAVLKGAESILQDDRPDLFIECGKTGRNAVLDFLRPFGYRPLDVYAKTPTWHFTAE